MSRPTPVRIDFPLELESLPGAGIAARRFAPDPDAAARLPDPLWIFAVPGSTGDWRYWDLSFPGHPDEDYSFAAFFAARGIGTIAIDTLGTGDSVFPHDGAKLTLELLAAANHQASSQAREQLPDDALVCGVGHSGGGGVSIVQQGTWASFDFLATLGAPADDWEIHGGHDAVRSEFEIDEHGMLVRDAPGPAARARGYLDDVPDDIVFGRPILPFPQSFPSVMKRGTVLPYAQKVTCPVFVGMGEVDYVGSPLEEPGRYEQSADVSVYVQPGSAHWHNMSSVRVELWTALHNWLWGRARFRDGRRPNTAQRS